MKRKTIAFTVIGCCLFLCIVSLLFRGKSEQYDQEQTAIEPETVEQTTVEQTTEQTPVEQISVEQTPFFFPENQSSVTFDLKASFVMADKDIPTETEVVVSKIAEGKEGNLYSVKINLDIDYTEWFSGEWDRYELGYFYVTADKIYLIRDKEMAERFKEEELKEKGTVVCQETEKKDPIEGEKGWHEYITVEGDNCEFHSYNDLVETGFYEAFIWEKEKGLVKYWSGYGAERDAITLERSGVSRFGETDDEASGDTEAEQQLETDKEAYASFLRNEISATDSNGKEYRISDWVDEYDNAKYIYRDIDGDGKEELHISSRFYYALKYDDNTLKVLFYEGAYQCPVNNGELCGILHMRPGGAPQHKNYYFTTFTPEGEAVEGPLYEWYDTNENHVADAEDRYLKDDVELSQEEWNRETKVYQGIGYGEDKWVDEWVHDWIPVVVMW